jgi:hypothetical protein
MTHQMKAIISFETSVNTNVQSQKNVTLDSTAVQTSSLPEFPFLQGGELIALLRDYWLVRGRSVELAFRRT